MSTQPQATAPESLSELQKILTHFFRHDAPIADDPERARVAAAHVAGNSRLTPAEQVDIYRRQFWLRHVDVIAEDFPALSAILGEDDLYELSRAYLMAHPPSDPNLKELGTHLPTFAATYPFPVAKAALARDLARYELAFLRVFDGVDPDPLDPSKLAALTPDAWERARLLLSPVVQLLAFDYPVHRVRLALKKADPSEPSELDPHDPPRAPVYLALFRKDFVVHFEELSHDAFTLLTALAAGAPLLAACAEIADGKTPEQAAALAKDLGEWFRFWAQRGFIRDVVIDPR